MTKKLRQDGWTNILTGLGVAARDKRLSTKYGASKIIDHHTLTAMYRSDGFTQRVVNLAADDMTRKWISIEGDTDNSVVKHLETLRTRLKVNELLKWARLYGGAIAIIGVDDGQELDMPVNEKNIKDVNFLHVFDRHQVTVYSYFDDPRYPLYGQPSHYQVSPLFSGEMFVVHSSRVLRMSGTLLPPREMRSNHGWGDSVVQTVSDQLANTGVSYSSAAQLMHDFVQTVMTVNGLAEILASGNDDVVLKRAQLISLTRSISNLVIIDKEEKYEKQTTSVAGLPEMLREFAMAVCACTGYPYTLFMGQSPAGMDATGDADIRFYYDNIAAKQNDELRPELEKLVRYTMLSKKGPTRGAELSNWNIMFTPLWQMTEEQVVDMRAKQAETDERYIASGVLSPAEVAESRFGGDSYSIETQLSLSPEERSALSAPEDDGVENKDDE